MSSRHPPKRVAAPEGCFFCACQSKHANTGTLLAYTGYLYVLLLIAVILQKCCPNWRVISCFFLQSVLAENAYSYIVCKMSRLVLERCRAPDFSWITFICFFFASSYFFRINTFSWFKLFFGHISFHCCGSKYLEFGSGSKVMLTNFLTTVYESNVTHRNF